MNLIQIELQLRNKKAIYLIFQFLLTEEVTKYLLFAG